MMKSMAEKMKPFFIAITILGLMTGCEFFMGSLKEPDSIPVTIELGPGNGARAALPPAVTDAFRYKMELRGSGGRVITHSVEPGQTTIKISLVLGEWTVNMEAYTTTTPEGVLAGRGTVTFTVAPGIPRVIIPMFV
jgi:hypothetical protein